MKERKREARSYFRVTVALPSVSRRRLCASRCILPTHLPQGIVYVRVCTCCIYIWPRRAESGFGALAGVRACIRPCVSMCAYICARAERGSVVPAVLLFGIARRVNPGQCVVKKKPRVRPEGLLPTRSGSRRRGGKREGRDANVHVHMHAHSVGNAFATVARCRTVYKAAPSFTLQCGRVSVSRTHGFCQFFGILPSLFETTKSKLMVTYLREI